mgnify:FL=1
MQKTRYGISHWLDRYSEARKVRNARFPRHKGNLDLDVAIIGGGLTGCATAQAFAASGVRVGLVESDRIGQGASANSTAFVMQEPDIDFQDLVASFGLRAARTIWEMTRRAALDLPRVIRHLKIKCELESQDSVYLASDKAAVKRLRQDFDARRKAGFQVRWLTADRVARETNLRAEGAIRVSGNTEVDPYRLCLGLARSAAARGATIFEQSPVKRVRRFRNHVQLFTERGRITAGHVVVALGDPTGLFKPLRRHFRRTHTYVVVTPPLGAKVRRELGRRNTMIWDTQEPYHYLRWTRDDRIVFGGADQAPTNPRRRKKVLIQRAGQLMYELSTHYPVISGIQPEYAWDGPIVNTPDGLPYIGPHRNFPRHLFALGFGGNGLALGFLSSRILLRHYLDEPVKGDDLFAFSR